MPKPASVVNEGYFSQRTAVSEAGCWEWNLNLTCFGYGEAKVKGKTWKAHRLAWTYFNGPIPEGLNVCHRCDNRKCCNPDHLFIGTTQDNVDDKMMKGRFKPAHGSDNGYSKLTEADVLAILADQRTQRVIADAYGVSQSNISIIKRGLGWQHI